MDEVATANDKSIHENSYVFVVTMIDDVQLSI